MKVIKWFLKAISAGVVTVLVLSLCLTMYSYTPVHIDNTAGNTDYVWISNSPWVKMTEGIGWGRFDEAGYNNVSVVENPDVVVLGSSHMEATHVKQKESAPYLLGEKLKDKYSVYNMGIAGHHFLKVCQYLPENLALYEKTPKAFVIEGDEVKFTTAEIDQMLEGKIKKTPSHNKGLVFALQKLPLLRLVYHQFESGLIDVFLPELSAKAPVAAPAPVATVDLDAYDRMFAYLSQLEQEYNTQLIIAYHPFETLKEDGSIEFKKDEYLKAFTDAAKKYDITFIDMADRFEAEYYEKHHVPHGFPNSKTAFGHLNKYGHAAMADEAAKAILALEES